MSVSELQARVDAALEAEMARQGLTRSALARQLGASAQWVSMKLNGHRDWSIADLQILEDGLGVPASVFLMPSTSAVTTDELVQARRRRRAHVASRDEVVTGQYHPEPRVA